MRIYLQSKSEEDEQVRFVHLVLQQDLLGGWSLLRESGRQGSAGKIVRQHFETQSDAIEMLIKTRDRTLARGYYVVFIQGDTPPQ